MKKMKMTKRRRKYHPGITEKRLNNKRFRRTEEAILKAYMEGDFYLSVGEMAKKAGVARSTVYSHHRTVKEIVPDYKRYVLRNYSRMINKMIRRGRAPMRNVFLRTLGFIAAHRRVFVLLERMGDREVVSAMIDRISEKIGNYAKLPKRREKIFLVYRGEVMAVVGKWIGEGCENEEMGQVLGDLMYLTDTMKARLGKIEEN